MAVVVVVVWRGTGGGIVVWKGGGKESWSGVGVGVSVREEGGEKHSLLW